MSTAVLLPFAVLASVFTINTSTPLAPLHTGWMPAVRCATANTTWLGLYEGGVIYVRAYLCADMLRAYAGHRDRYTMQGAATGIFALAHELGHASGIPETPADHDHAANVYASEHWGAVGVRLGFPRALLHALAQYVAGWGT